ncbi:uncharacterized protein AC631_02267 [Debaryomyces fabryi]|uniref:Clathrin/coatomer adaptor adaptin-like N-terminal domain-containing protein n=1 Tax=Debaryomyces fabryi TaxID=58627 RepID=A0A0V1Q0B6_9ASCO|nr:uncharacterized protein AC631_02267 [Debaryomyces fabryi]KSA01976.1 hypothetical protein AC631_02267 [Debaryomyces fabryi]CUM54535.1 unnamed protein product [Debaryomyces fabryi]
MTESLAKISSMLESARDLTIEVAASASSRLSETPSALRPKEISKLLNSRVDRDNLSGMKCVISSIARGEDGLPYFADVVKNITSANSKVKNLVLIYLTRYAEVEPDTALLSINSIQKSLNDKNPIDRATAIRSMAGIRIASIAPILLLCIKRTISDPSPLVRASTAIAIGKVYDMENTKNKQLLEYLSKLLADSNSQVVGTALKTYFKVMPHLKSNHKKWEPMHGNFRRFCNIVRELDEWSQSFMIEILTEYSRVFLPRPKLYLKNDSSQVIDLPDDYSKIPFQEYEVSMDKDLQLFVDSLKPLIYSRSEFVILSISKALSSLTPPRIYKELQINVALSQLASSLNNIQVSLYALHTIASLSSSDQTIFSPYFKKFYVYPTDPVSISIVKLQILSLLANEDNVKYIFEELKYYSVNSMEIKIANEAIRAIGSCSQISPYWNEKILKWCLKQIKILGGSSLNELLTVIRYLIQQKQNFMDVKEKEDIIKSSYRLSLVLQDGRSNLESEAKASIIWIIGEFTEAANNSIGPDVLRLLIKTFALESEIVRYETLVLSAKILSFELDKVKNEVGDDNSLAIEEFLQENIVSQMFQHVLQLAKYDPSYDTRDRARMFNVLLNTGSKQSQLASLFLRVPKPVPLSTLFSKGINSNEFSTTNVLLKYFNIIEWADPSTHPPSSIRKVAPIQSNNLGGKIVSISSSSMHNKSTSPEPLSEHAISSRQYQNSNVDKIIPKPVYHLQSLDEFFGSEEESEEEESDEEDSEDEEEEDSEEEESEEDSEDEANENKGIEEEETKSEVDIESDSDENGSENQ